MPKWYKATCLKEIHWHGKTYRQDDTINVIEADMTALSQASVIGNVRTVDDPASRTEFAVNTAPENQMREHRGKRPVGRVATAAAN